MKKMRDKDDEMKNMRDNDDGEKNMGDNGDEEKNMGGEETRNVRGGEGERRKETHVDKARGNNNDDETKNTGGEETRNARGGERRKETHADNKARGNRLQMLFHHVPSSHRATGGSLTSEGPTHDTGHPEEASRGDSLTRDTNGR